MENWDWSVGRSVDELAEYMRYALQILHNIDLPCEGLTTPGGFGSRARQSLAKATLEACRDVYQAEIPHYFPRSVLPGRGERRAARRVRLRSGDRRPPAASSPSTAARAIGPAAGTTSTAATPTASSRLISLPDASSTSSRAVSPPAWSATGPASTGPARRPGSGSSKRWCGASTSASTTCVG